MIAATVAWDKRLSRTYEQAIASLETTMEQVGLFFFSFSSFNLDLAAQSVNLFCRFLQLFGD